MIKFEVRSEEINIKFLKKKWKYTIFKMEIFHIFESWKYSRQESLVK